MFRRDFQELAQARLRDARTLLRQRGVSDFSGAYHLAGFAVECALKACIAKLTRAEEFPDKKSDVNTLFSHDLKELAVRGGLKSELAAEISRNPLFAVSWATVVEWKIEARYKTISKADAKRVYNAVADQTNGVMQWLEQHY